MALFSTPQPQQQTSPFSFNQQQPSNPFSLQTSQQQQQSSPFSMQPPPQPQPSPFSMQPQPQPSPFSMQPQPQQQSSPFSMQPQPQQQFQQQQQHQQQQLFLFTNDKTPSSYSTKWADLHPDSHQVLLKIEERITEYRDESQRLDQCSRLFDSSVSNKDFELDASRILQELGGISTSMVRQNVVMHELMAVTKDMLRNAEIAVRSFMMLRPRFLHQKANSGLNPTSQGAGGTAAPGGAGQLAAITMLQVADFYSGIPKKSSPFMQQTVARFEKELGECRQWIEELEQLLLSDTDRNSISFNSSVVHSLPKVLTNVHEFFVHVAAKVESIHQYIASMRSAYLADQRHRGDGNDPFLEADRREVARQEAAAKRVHPTLHLPAPPQLTTQVAGLFASSGTPGVSTTPQTSATPVQSVATGLSIFGTSLSTPASNSFAPLLSTPAPATGSSFFLSTGASSQPSVFPSSSPPLFGPAATSPFGAASSATSGNTLFSTPFGSGPALASGSSLGTSRNRSRARTTRR